METILVFLVTLLASGLFILISLLYYRKISNPILLCNVFILLAVVSAIADRQLDDMRLSRGILWITIGMIFFEVFFLVAQSLFDRKTCKRDITYNKQIVLRLAMVCFISSIVMLIISISILSNITNGNIMLVITRSTYVRGLYLKRSTPRIIGLFQAFVTINYYSTMCILPSAILLKVNHAKKIFISVILLNFTNSILTMSKETFFITIIIIMSAYLLSLPNIKSEISFLKKNGIWILALAVVLLVVVAFQRDYVGTRYESYFESVIGTFTRYLGSPISSFCLLIDLKHHELVYGTQIFRPFFNILYYLGIGERASIIQEFIDVRFGNVYSAFGNMYNDFGFLGIVFLSAILGTLFGVIYQRGNNLRYNQLAVNSIINMTMVFMYYDFKLNQTVYLFAILYGFLVEKLLKKYMYMESINEEYN